MDKYEIALEVYGEYCQEQGFSFPNNSSYSLWLNNIVTAPPAAAQEKGEGEG
jgi:hypothetical protein